MDGWVYLPLAFISGLALGGVYGFLQFRARLKFYRQFIERRLSLASFPSAPIQEQSVRPTWRPTGLSYPGEQRD